MGILILKQETGQTGAFDKVIEGFMYLCNNIQSGVWDAGCDIFKMFDDETGLGEPDKET